MLGYLGPLDSLASKFNAWRAELGLQHPGTIENFGKEVKNVHLTNYAFDGARADLSKTLLAAPSLFQVSHGFQLGGTSGPMGGVNPGTYSFGAAFQSDTTTMSGNLDNEGSLTGRYQLGFTPAPSAVDAATKWVNVVKAQAQLSAGAAAPSMLQLEYERNGLDYCASLKAYNPSPADLTGVYFASYLQSVTRNLALGVETIWQRPGELEEASLGYMAKYTGSQRNWVATAQLLPQGVLQTTYWHKLAEAVEAGVDLLMVPHPIAKERKAVATAGVKYDYRAASLRAQVDSTGKISAFLEQRLSPMFAFLLSGEIDHVKHASKFGVGIMLASGPTDEEFMAQQQAAAAQGKPSVF